MAITDLELEIRSALAGEAAGYAVPPELKARTLEVASARRGKARRFLRRHRWVYALAAAGVLPVLFALGAAVKPAPPRPGTSASQKAFGAPGHVSNINGTLGEINGTLNGTNGDVGVLKPAAPAGSLIQPSAAGAPATLPSPGGGFQQSVVRTASVSVRVPRGHFADAWSQAVGVAGRFGGLVSNSTAQTVNGRLDSGSLTIRVPSTSLDPALAALGSLGTVSSQSTTSQDESGQVASNAAQLTALQAEETQYLQLLPQAKSTADILAIEQPLAAVTQQIQTLQASQSYLQNQVAMASIQATLSEPGTQPASVKPEGRLAKAWRQAGTGVTTVVAGAIVALGYLLAPVLLLLLAWAASRRLRRSRI